MKRIIPYEYEEEKNESGMTGLAGLLLPLELIYGMELNKVIENHIRIREIQGYSDSQQILSLILLNLAGGDCVDDIKILEGDIGFRELAIEAEKKRIKKRIWEKGLKRFRRLKRRGFPSPSAIFRYLFEFHNESEEKIRPEDRAFIPSANEYLKGLKKINEYIVKWKQKHTLKNIATLDQDATLIASQKEEAKFCHKGFRSYQPLNTYWFEQGIVLHTEFRDGNVPAGYEQLRVLEEALEMLPEGVERVRLRSDTAGYQHEILRYCEKGVNKRFGRIEFAVCCDVTPAFRKAVVEVGEEEWNPLRQKVQGEFVEGDHQWAEVCFVPNEIAHSKNDPVYRYLAIREPFVYKNGQNKDSNELSSLHIEEMDGKKYKIFGIVTNMNWEGESLIHWQHERCGKSEGEHSAMKEELAGGKLPSKYFGANAAWWWIMILSLNILHIFQQQILKEGWEKKRIKAIRFHIFNLPARLISHAKKWIVRLTHNHPSNELLMNARRRILLLSEIPVG